MGFTGDKSFPASPTPWIHLAKSGLVLVSAGVSRSGRAPSQRQRRRSRLDSFGRGSRWMRHGFRECLNGGRQPHQHSWNSGGSIWLGLVTCVCLCVQRLEVASVYAFHGWNAMAGKQGRGWKEGHSGGSPRFVEVEGRDPRCSASRSWRSLQLVAPVVVQWLRLIRAIGRRGCST